MQVTNRSRGTILVTDGRRARKLFDRSIGLMLQAGLPPGAGLLIEPCKGIHSCFMRFRFDAVFLDPHWKVLHAIHAMAPWRISRIVPKASAVLELPAGTLASTGTEVGDVLHVEG